MLLVSSTPGSAGACHHWLRPGHPCLVRVPPVLMNRSMTFYMKKNTQMIYEGKAMAKQWQSNGKAMAKHWQSTWTPRKVDARDTPLTVRVPPCTVFPPRVALHLQ